MRRTPSSRTSALVAKLSRTNPLPSGPNRGPGSRATRPRSRKISRPELPGPSSRQSSHAKYVAAGGVHSINGRYCDSNVPRWFRRRSSVRISRSNQSSPVCKAVMVARRPKWPNRHRSSSGRRSVTARITGDPVTAAAHFRPAKLKALLADRRLIATSAPPGTVSIGVKRPPGKTSGAWISSLMMVTPKRSASLASAASSSGVWILPTGLCGLLEDVGNRMMSERRLQPVKV